MTKSPYAPARWWKAYERYLMSPFWLERRRRVLERARNMCEGCLSRRAVHVHHREYPRDALPGTAAWIRAEKLFMLVALCEACHQDLHPLKTFVKFQAGKD
jgi:hypothetical protein